MANTTLTIANLSTYLMTSWSKNFMITFNTRTPLLNMMQSKMVSFPAGSSHYIRQLTDENLQFAPIASGGTLPQKGKMTWDRYTIDVKHFAIQAAIDGPVIEQALGGKNNAAEMLTSIKEGMIRSAKKNIERELFGDGTAKLGVITAYTGGTPSITLAAGGDKTKLSRYMKNNMYIAVHNDSDDTVRGAVSVVSVNRTTNVVTISGTVASTDADDYVCLALQGGTSSYNNGLSGLGYHVDDGTDIVTYQGLTRANYEIAKAKLLGNSGTNRDLSLDILGRAYLHPEIATDATADDPAIFICDPGMFLQYLKLFESRTEYTPQQEGKGGWGEPAFNGKKLTKMSDAPYNTLLYIRPQDYTLFYHREWKLVPGGSGEALHFSQGDTNTDSYTLTAIARMNLACIRPNAQVKIPDLTQTVLTP